MSQKPEISIEGDNEAEYHRPESETYTDDDPFAELAVEGNSDNAAFAFSTLVDDEETPITESKPSEIKSSTSEHEEVKVGSEPAGTYGKVSGSRESAGRTEIPRETENYISEYSLSPRALPDINTPQRQSSPRPFEGDEVKDTANPKILPQDSLRSDSRQISLSYDSDGLEEHAARDSYALMSCGSRTTMIIHFSPDETSCDETASEDLEEMKLLEITSTCASTSFAPEYYNVQRSSFNLDIIPSDSEANSVERLKKETEIGDDNVGEIFEYLHGLLQSTSNSKAVENLSSLERAFAKKGETQQEISQQRDDLVSMHLKFVGRVAEEMTKMKMNPCGWVSLS